MTEVTYENGRVDITTATGMRVGFRMCDIDYDSRSDIVRAVSDIPPPQDGGEAGFLHTQPVEERQRAIDIAAFELIVVVIAMIGAVALLRELL